MNYPKTQHETTFEKISEWLPLILIAGGLAAEWLHFEYAPFIWITGFFLYGLLGLINSVRKKYYSKVFSFAFLKLILEVTTIFLALTFLTGINTFYALLLLILLDRFVVRDRAK